MRHGVFGKKLSRDTKSRKALLNNLASAVLVNGQVITTLAKAKFARVYVEKLVTSAKKNKLSQNRQLASSLTGAAFLRLTREIGPGFKNRNGGYTRIVKLANRRGDASPMARLEFIEWDKSASKAPKQADTKAVKVEKKANFKKEKLTKNSNQKPAKTAGIKPKK